MGRTNQEKHLAFGAIRSTPAQWTVSVRRVTPAILPQVNLPNRVLNVRPAGGTGTNDVRTVRNWPGALGRIGGWTGGALVVWALIAGSALGAERVARSAVDAVQGPIVTNDANSAPTGPAKPIREGTLLDNTIGTFKATGDRMTFYSQANGGKGLRVLENLALERIWHILDNTRGRQWNVSGVVTEYRGENFLLMNRAVLKPRPDQS